MGGGRCGQIQADRALLQRGNGDLSVFQRQIQAAVARGGKQTVCAAQEKYILDEGNDIPAFVDLGVFTKDFKVVRSRYDKFRQVNRFIETVDDLFKDSVPKKLTVADFGCGKSYLTFFLYHYLTNVRK